MFEGPRAVPDEATSQVMATLDLLVTSLAGLDSGPLDDVLIIDCLQRLERVKGAAAAAQARLTDRLVVIRQASDLVEGASEQTAGRGVAHEVALARRESPHDGRGRVALARALVHDLPETLAALGRGDISEHRAQIVARETAVLTSADRAVVDATLAHRLPELGNRALMLPTRRLAYELDHQATVKRMVRARSERRVTSRPVSDGMVLLSAVVPAPEGTAVMLSLTEYAGSQRAEGDQRTRSQIMADIFCQRLVGHGSAVTPTVGVEVQLVMTAEMLLAGDDTQAAHLRGYGPLPSSVARDLVASTKGRVLLRRLYANPDDRTLVAMDSRRRLFEGELRHLLVNRDERCRTPWCDAPIRHADHVENHARGGPTQLGNGQGLCESCSYAKELPGWSHHVLQPWPHRHHVRIRTPTGHHHHSIAPPLPVDADR
ncbi:conserved hypothetical protein [metagenome]|uniref:DUF222 domain-containing protein n=1 Tax=metagenome TaxID=256318 RepID=A0A2P2C1X8_9ZZZZ